MMNERQQKILQMLQQRSSLSISELSQLFEVTPMTIRRDVDSLVEMDKVIRVHGGVMVKELPKPEREEYRATTHIEQKKAIARYACKLVSERQTLFIDTGSTTLELAKLLVDFHNITVITNSINVLSVLASSPGINLIGLGGAVYTGARSFIGQFAEAAMKRFYCDIAFLGMRSVSVDEGLTEQNFFEADLKQLIMKQSRRKVLLVDSSKFLRLSPIQVAPVTEVNDIVTDEGLSSDIVTAIDVLGVKVHLARGQEL
jgi:DeoR/GlpR family transcriptional regulator of sugar metabolism